MSKVVDLTNQRFGRLVVIKRGPSDKYGKAQWWCRCDCGSEEKLISGAALRRGLVVSCGCNKKEKLKKYNDTKVVNEVGNVYGYLTVLSRVEGVVPKDGRAQWLCQCKCGKQIVTTGKLLRTGHKLSCGCMKVSKGEMKIEQILIENCFSYATQYVVYIDQDEYEVKQKHPYYFDFAILDSVKKVSYLIEYDGKQHFEYKENSNFWNSKEDFLLTQKRDNIKNKYCLKNSIPLIRIPYTHLEDITIDDLKLETTTYLVKG